MRPLVLAALLAGSMQFGVPAAHACPPQNFNFPCGGRKCGFNSTTDVTREAGWQLGVINAGPLVTLESGTLHCAIHVNNNDHSGPEAASVDAAAIGGIVAVIAPQELHYQASAADTVSLCTTWHGASGTLYWHSPNPAVPTDLGSWDTNPTNCGEALSIEPNDPECSIWLAIDQRAGTNIAEIWQDCEPYEPII